MIIFNPITVIREAAEYKIYIRSGLAGLLLKKPNSKISEHLSFDE